MVFFLVAISTPAWVSQELKVPVGAAQYDM
jgi:hypothetical protein